MKPFVIEMLNNYIQTIKDNDGKPDIQFMYFNEFEGYLRAVFHCEVISVEEYNSYSKIGFSAYCNM